MLDHKLDGAVDLGVDALDSAGLRVGHPRSIGQEIQADAAVTEEASRPGERLDLAGVETPIDEFGEVFSARAIAAGESETRQQGPEASKGRLPVQCVERLRVELHDVVGTRESHGEGGRRLCHRVAERHGLLAATDGSQILRQGRRTGIDQNHGVERESVGDTRHLIGGCEPNRRDGTREMRCSLLQVAGIDRRAAQHGLESGCLLRPVHEADAPVLGKLPPQQL